jgi:hypothetical protein
VRCLARGREYRADGPSGLGRTEWLKPCSPAAWLPVSNQTRKQVRVLCHICGHQQLITSANVEELSKLFLTLDRPIMIPDEKSLFDTVNNALAQVTHSELDRRALWAFIYAREKLTFAKRLSDIRMWVQGYKEGQRGVMVSPLSCRPPRFQLDYLIP